MKYRINRYIALAGVCSRRKADELINNGEVTLNGKKVLHPGIEIDSENDVLQFKGKEIKIQNNYFYFLLNKPTNCISTTKSQDNQMKTVLDFLPKIKERLYPVGRLDKTTTGALIITNDGNLTNMLLHPKKKIEKEYKATVKGKLNKRDIQILREGVPLKDGKTLPAKVFVNKKAEGIYHVKITISEGRNRQVKRMFNAVKTRVFKLHRSKFAGISVGNLNPGEWRSLTLKEINYLHSITQ